MSGPYSNEQAAAIRERIRAATSAGRRAAPKRHPADVTADRLTEHYEKWHAKFDGHELDAIGEVIQALREIAEGAR